MSKLLRSELKSIVKECLIEILSEGINNNIQEKSISQDLTERSNFTSQKNYNVNKNLSHLDKINFNKSDDIKKNNFVNLKTTKITNDPVLNALLADTAKTTLQEQLTAESRKGIVTTGADSATIKANESSPAELFGLEAAGKWEKLAFFDK